MQLEKGDVVRLSPQIQREMYHAGCASSLECWEVMKCKHDVLTLTPVLSSNYKLAFIQIKADRGNVTKVRVVEG
jgi:hypothetical protein